MENPTENDRKPDNRAGCAVADGSAFCVYRVRDLQAYGYGPRGYALMGEFSTLVEALDFMDDKPGCWDREEKWSYDKSGNQDWICKQMQKPCPEIIGGTYPYGYAHLQNLLTRRDLPNKTDQTAGENPAK